MQDEAPPHYLAIVRQFLDVAFPNSWIGRECPIAWPSQSPDLTPMDFSVWGIVRDIVYQVVPLDINDLNKTRIRIAFETFTPDLCERICKNVEDRCGACIVAGGHQFEHTGLANDN